MARRRAALATAAIAASALSSACAADSGTTVTLAGGPAFAVEVADDPAERAQGLAGREEMDPGTGMLFVYPQAGQYSYWMQGMQIPIDLAWIRDGAIAGIVTLQPCPAGQPCEQYPSPGPVDMVLEVANGALSGVAAGTAITVD